MKIAIMQPYFCPYIGYFQLVASVDRFIFYDDVNYIKGGWINRNRIVSNGKEFLFTIPLVDASSFKLIKDTEINWRSKEITKLVNNIRMSYRKAAFYGDVFPIVESLFDKQPETIAKLAIDSIVAFSGYLELATEFRTSSEQAYDKTGDKVLNIVNILKAEQADNYINPIGGQDIYTKEQFAAHNIRLDFLKGTGSLSIIDVCMNQDKNLVREAIMQYQLV